MLFGPPTANPPPSSSWAMLLQITEFGAHTSNPFADHHLPPKSKATLSRLRARKLQPTKCKWPLVTALNTSRPWIAHTTRRNRDWNQQLLNSNSKLKTYTICIQEPRIIQLDKLSLDWLNRRSITLPDVSTRLWRS